MATRNQPDVVKTFFETVDRTEPTVRKLAFTNVSKAPKVSRSELELVKKREQMLRAAYDEGFQKGYDHGILKGVDEGRKEALEQAYAEAKAEREKELVVFRAGLEKVLTSTEEAMSRWYALAEEELGPIVLEIANKVIVAELRLGRESLEEIIRDAMKEITHASRARIRVNPIDAPDARFMIDEIKAALVNLEQIEVVEDNSIEAGCVIETDGGLVDARIENKIEVLRNALREAA